MIFKEAGQVISLRKIIRINITRTKSYAKCPDINVQNIKSLPHNFSTDL